MASSNQNEEVKKNSEKLVEELGRELNISMDGNPFDIDAILDQIPENRRGIKYTDGWDPAKLDEELKLHPFFMKEMPKEGESWPPLLEALQQLKYSETDNSPLELAVNYKEDGNFHFKLKKYRIAAACFTEGLKWAALSNDPKMEAQLYNNRAAAQFYLENFRSALADCDKSLQKDPSYFKPAFKAVECCAKLKKWEKCLKYVGKCEGLVRVNSEVEKYRLLAERQIKMGGAKERKSEFLKRALKAENEKILSFISERGIKMRNHNFLNASNEEVKKVKIGDDERLNWPLLFCYPQYSQSDFIQEFHEDSTFREHLVEILDNEAPAWDKNSEYKSGSVDVYFIDFKSCGHVKVNIDTSLSSILQSQKYCLPSDGIPTFLVMSKNNEMCKVLLERIQDASV